MKVAREIKIGIIGTITIALFFWGLNFLKGKNIFKNAQYYYGKYDDISGLKDANTVYLRGFKVGQVSDISILNDTNRSILVEIYIEEDIDIPVNSVMAIINDGYMGVKAINLKLSQSDKMHQEGDTLRSEVTKGLLDELEPVKDKAENLFSTVDSVMQSLNHVFDPETRENLKNSIANLEEFSASLNDNNSKLNRMLSHIESITGNIRAHNEEIGVVMSNLANVSDSLVQAELRQTINTTHAALSQTYEILEKINNGEGSLGMLVNNDTLYQHLEEASLNLDRLLIDMIEHPKRYVHFSIFGRKEPSK